MIRLLKPDAYVNSVFTITPERLIKNGIYGLIIDIDNTLVTTYTKEADQKVIAYIKNLNVHGVKTIIVSNARKERVEQFCKPLDIEFVYKALKPFGRGYNLAIQKMNLPKEKVAIVGDQLFTDVLGGKIKGIHSILIKPIDKNEPFLIRVKRILEKPFVSSKHFRDKY